MKNKKEKTHIKYISQRLTSLWLEKFFIFGLCFSSFFFSFLFIPC